MRDRHEGWAVTGLSQDWTHRVHLSGAGSCDLAHPGAWGAARRKAAVHRTGLSSPATAGQTVSQL